MGGNQHKKISAVYAMFNLWDAGQLFNNRYEWRSLEKYKQQIATPARNIQATLRFNSFGGQVHRRDAEDAEITQRNTLKIGTLLRPF